MAAFHTVLIADDEASIRRALTLVLAEHGYEVRAVADGQEALAELHARPYDVVISDLRMPKVDGFQLLQAALDIQPGLTFLVMSAYGTKDEAIKAVGMGAYDFIQKPFKPEEVVFVFKKAAERQRLLRENRRLKRQRYALSPLDALLGTSSAMEALKQQLRRVAATSTTVLVCGESGVGKELVARALHQLSPRAQEAFVAVNCGAFPLNLIESELFGHVRGAFTDAKHTRRGLFSEADGGSIFLDEVGELPQAAQVKLLRVLQEGEVRLVGASRAEKVDVRVIAATLRDLASLVEKGEFREDLYYRLNVIQLRVPPLRERQEDVSLLAQAFLVRFNRALNREAPVHSFSPETEARLLAYAWPGNVRELENAIECAVLLADGPVIVPGNLPEKIWRAPQPHTTPPLVLPEKHRFSLKRAIRDMEEAYIRKALQHTQGNRTHAAALLEISYRALLYKLKSYHIEGHDRALAEEAKPPT